MFRLLRCSLLQAPKEPKAAVPEDKKKEGKKKEKKVVEGGLELEVSLVDPLECETCCLLCLSPLRFPRQPTHMASVESSGGIHCVAH
jgi:hypothetical protein